MNLAIRITLAASGIFLFVGMAGGVLFAVYLLTSARLTGVHMNDVYSSQSIQDFKNFVRFHIRPDGGLEIFPIAVPVVPRDDGWTVKNGTGLAPAADIRAELDEDALEAFHGTVSLPFAAGDNRKVAVKIVDDRGIESLRIVDLD